MKVVLLALAPPYCGPTLSVGYLKTFVESDPLLRQEVEVVIREFSTLESFSRMEARLLEDKPDVLGLSFYMWSASPLLQLARRVKTALPRCRVVGGGPDASPVALDFLNRNPEVEVMVKKEGEETFAAFLKVLVGGGGLNNVEGLVFRQDGRLLETPDRAFLQDLSILPSPYLKDVFDRSTYRPAAVIETSRGCPYDCKYCDYLTRQKFRYFPMEQIIAETEFLLRNRLCRTIIPTDSDLFMNPKRGAEFLRGFLRVAEEENFGLMYVNVNPANITDEIIELLGRTHRIWMPLGIQSTDRDVLRRNTRGFQKDKVERILKRLREQVPGVYDEIQLIFGMPGDTPAATRRSVDWSISQRTTELEIFPALRLAGSGYVRDPKAFPMEWDPEPPYTILSTDTMSREEMAGIYDFRTGIYVLHCIPVVRDVLYVLGHRRRTEGELAFLRTYERFLEKLDEEEVKDFLVKDRGFKHRGTSSTEIGVGGFLNVDTMLEKQVFLRNVHARLRDFVAEECGAEEGLREYLWELIASSSREMAWIVACEGGLWGRLWNGPFHDEWGPRDKVLLVGSGLLPHAGQWRDWVGEVDLLDLTGFRYSQARYLYPHRDRLRQSFSRPEELESRLGRLDGPYAGVFFLNVWQVSDKALFQRWMEALAPRLAPRAAVVVSSWTGDGPPPAAWEEKRRRLKAVHDLMGPFSAVSFPLVAESSVRDACREAGLREEAVLGVVRDLFPPAADRPRFSLNRLAGTPVLAGRSGDMSPRDFMGPGERHGG